MTSGADKHIKLLFVFYFLAGVLVCLRFRFKIFEVYGDSMEPTLLRGEKLVGISHLRLRTGDIVVFEGGIGVNKLIKRIKLIEGNKVIVEGDNRIHSTDSRQFGPIDKSQIKFKIIYRYFPLERSGFIS